MYGTSAQYGWSSNPGVRTSNVIELPLAPVRRQTVGGMCCRCCSWHSFGIILSLLAAASLALGVADVVVTYQNYMVGYACNSTGASFAICNPNTLLWTWIASGIWASIPIFIFGILAIRRGSNPMTQNCWFEAFAFLSGFIFAPAMIVLSAFEVYKGAGVYYWTYQNPLKADDLVKAIIPIVIAGLGLLELLMCVTAFWDICCQGQGQQGMGTYSTGTVQVVRAPAPVFSSAPVMRTSNCAPCNGIVNPQSATIYRSAPPGGAFYSTGRPSFAAPAMRSIGASPYSYYGR